MPLKNKLPLLVSFLARRDSRLASRLARTIEAYNKIIHQTHYEKSDWSRAVNQFTIACGPDMIYAISAADIAFIMSRFNVCLVTKPLGVFSSETKWLNASLLFLRMNYAKNV